MRPPARDDRVEAVELDDADRGLQVGHSVVVADLDVLLGRRQRAWCRSAALTLIACSRSIRARAAHASFEVVNMPPSPVVMSLRGWNDHAAMTPLGADRTAVVGRAGRARGVFDHDDAAGIAQRPDGGTVGGYATLMDQDHRPGGRREHRVDRFARSDFR